MASTWDQLQLVDSYNAKRCLPFANLLIDDARDSTLAQALRIAWFGDSQADKSASGRKMEPAINRQLGLVYGNLPESSINCINPGQGYKNAGAPTGVRVADTTGRASTVGGGTRPPNHLPGGSIDYVSGDANGCGFIIQPDWFDTDPLSGFAGMECVDRATATMGADVFVWNTNPTSGNVAWRVKRTNSSGGDYGAGDFSGTTTTNFSSATTQMYRERIGGNWTFSGNRYLTLPVTGSHLTNPTKIHGLCWVNTANTIGAVATCFGEGGYQTTSYTTTHANMGQCLRTMGFRMACIQLGINDAVGGAKTAATFKTDMNNLIDMLRGSTGGFGDPNFPIALIGGLYRQGGGLTEYDQYPGVMNEIERSRNGVVFINCRLATQRFGHGPLNVDLTGWTDRGRWAVATAYVVGDRVFVETGNAVTGSSFARHFICLVAHTSGVDHGAGANTDHPLRYNDFNSYWREIRQGAYHTTSFDGDDDVVHLSDFGAQLQAQTAVQGLFYAAALGMSVRMSRWRTF